MSTLGGRLRGDVLGKCPPLAAFSRGSPLYPVAARWETAEPVAFGWISRRPGFSCSAIAGIVARSDDAVGQGLRRPRLRGERMALLLNLLVVVILTAGVVLAADRRFEAQRTLETGVAVDPLSARRGVAAGLASTPHKRRACSHTRRSRRCSRRVCDAVPGRRKVLHLRSASRVQNEYSVCTAVMGCTAWARRIVPGAFSL